MFSVLAALALGQAKPVQPPAKPAAPVILTSKAAPTGVLTLDLKVPEVEEKVAFQVPNGARLRQARFEARPTLTRVVWEKLVEKIEEPEATALQLTLQREGRRKILLCQVSGGQIHPRLAGLQSNTAILIDVAAAKIEARVPAQRKGKLIVVELKPGLLQGFTPMAALALWAPKIDDRSVASPTQMFQSGFDVLAFPGAPDGREWRMDAAILGRLKP